MDFVEKLTPEEMTKYLSDVYGRLMENRYRYYILADPIMDDSEYDICERYYNDLVTRHGGKSMQMVDFDQEDPDAILAQQRVDSGTDWHSLWLKEMEPVWARIGKSKKQHKKEEVDKIKIPR